MWYKKNSYCTYKYFSGTPLKSSELSLLTCFENVNKAAAIASSANDIYIWHVFSMYVHEIYIKVNTAYNKSLI